LNDEDDDDNDDEIDGKVRNPIVALQSYPPLNSASSPFYSLSISSSALATVASTTGESSMF